MKIKKSSEVGLLWDENADLWIKTTSRGCDPHKDFVQKPAFFSILPDVSGKVGLDVGCGGGDCTRILSEKGASMTGVDISKKFIECARKEAILHKQDIVFYRADAEELDFQSDSFDFITSFVALMDMPNIDKVLSKLTNALKPGGFLQFSITHPCFWSHNMEWIVDQKKKTGLVCSDYLSSKRERISQWMFEGVDAKDIKSFEKKKFRTVLFHRTISEWLNLLVKHELLLEYVLEPTISSDLVNKVPALEGHKIVPYFLIIRARKPLHQSQID